MDISDLVNLPSPEKKLFLNAHPFCEIMNQLFPKYRLPDVVIQNADTSERSQTVKEWKKDYVGMFYKLKKRKQNRRIYLLPIGPFPSVDGADKIFDELNEYISSFLRIYFPGFEIIIMEILDHRSRKIRTRINGKSKQMQLYFPDVQNILSNIRPKDAFCICGLSWFDFYVSDSVSHILGSGITKGVAAFSFGHYGLYKEYELKEKEKFEEGHVSEEPFIIKDFQENPYEKNSSGVFDYITNNEQQEAQICSEGYNSLCSIVNSIGKPLSKKKFHLVRNYKRLSATTPPVSLTENSSDEIIEKDFEIIHFEEVMSQLSVKYDMLELHYVKYAIPENCMFTLNCKVMRRLFKCCVHQICHVIGLRHCYDYSCVMNSLYSVMLANQQSLLLCPICLRKLQIFLKFNVIDRYENLLKFFHDHRADLQQNGKPNLVCDFQEDKDKIERIMEFMLR